MYKISYLVNGVTDIHRRSYYPRDTLRCLPNVAPAQLHRYNGIISGHIHAPEKKTSTYTIDDVVEYTTVLDETRQDAIKELTKGKNTGTVTMLLTGGSGVAVSVYAYVNLIDVFTTGGVLTAIGCVTGLAVGYWRRRQFSNELDQWKNQLDVHVDTRRSLPKLRTSVINNLGYIDLYLTHVEANRLWRSDIVAMSNKLKFMSGSDLRGKLSCVHTEMNSSPFELSTVKSCGINGDDTTVLGEQTEFFKLRTEYDAVTASFSQKKQLLELGNDLATEKTNHRYDVINGTMDGVYIYDAVTGQRVWHSVYCSCNNCVLRNTFYAATRAVTECYRDSNLRSIDKEFNTKMSDVVAEYNSNVAPMINRLEALYTSAMAKLG